MGRPVPPNNVLQVAEVVLNPILNTGKGFRTQPSVKGQKGRMHKWTDLCGAGIRIGPSRRALICRPVSIGELSFSATLPSEPRLY